MQPDISVQSMPLCSSTPLWRRQPSRRRKVSISLCPLTGVKVDYSTILVGNGIIWIESDSFSKIADRLVEVALTPVHDTSIVVGRGIIWIEADSLAVIADRLIEVSLVTMGVPATEIGGCKRWVQPNRLGKFADRLVVVQFAERRYSTVEVNLRIDRWRWRCYR